MTRERREGNFATARTRREQGIISSILHADETAKDWPERAFVYLVRYAAIEPNPWTVEQFRIWARDKGLDDPPELRAFGGVTLRALHRKVIKPVGFQPTASSNGGRKPLYLGSVA